MTVSSTQSYVEYNSDGVTTTFTIPFYFLLNSDISVMVADSTGNISDPVNGTDFTVTGAGDSGGGSLTFGTVTASGKTILIYRNPPATQETKYYENGKFPAASHEAALDKLTMLIQEYGWRFDSLTLKKPSFFADYYDALNNRIGNLATPVGGSDAATKGYVDTSVSDFKEYVDKEVSSEATERKAADLAEENARASADANIQDQLTGNVPLEASAFSEISWHGQSIKNSVNIPDNKNAWSFGPEIAIAPGQQVSIGSGSTWTIADGREVEGDDLSDLIADKLTSTDGTTSISIVDIATVDDLSAKAAKGANSDITSLSGLSTPLSVAQGGNGNSTGNASSATKLATARTIQTSLSSSSASSFDGTGNITPGVLGTLPIANGGTGATTTAGILSGLGFSGSGKSGLVIPIGSNSFRIQTGSTVVTTDSNGNATITLPVALTTSHLVAIPVNGNSALGDLVVSLYNWSASALTGFSVHVSGSVSQSRQINWISIGY